MTFAHTLWLAAMGDDDPAGHRACDRADARRRIETSDVSRTVSHDGTLIARVRASDGAAFDELVRAYWMPLCHFATGYVHDPERAKELVADVFAALWERRRTWRVINTIESYLFGAVRNRARTMHRDVTRRANLLRDAVASGDVPGMSVETTAPNTFDVLDASDDIERRVHAAIDALPERLREATLLRWEQQMGYGELAEVLGVSEAAARQLVSRALRQLRAMLAGVERG